MCKIIIYSHEYEMQGVGYSKNMKCYLLENTVKSLKAKVLSSQSS